jgi:hypothetical protein
LHAASKFGSTEGFQLKFKAYHLDHNLRTPFNFKGLKDVFRIIIGVHYPRPTTVT